MNYFIQVVLVVVVLGLGLFRGIATDESVAVTAMQNQGFTNIEVAKKAWFIVGLRGCDERDAVRFTVTATNVRDESIETYVCSGWPFKGATIRSM